MADYTQLMNLEKKHNEQKPFSQSTKQSSNRAIDRSINQSITNLGTKVMDKPRGFYITARLNQRIDEAVRYFQEKHGIKKVDRSIVVTALLDNEAYWTEEALDLILDRVINQLTSRLTNR
jgi:hypothetical protein